MPAYLIANYTIRNQDGYNAYIASVGATIVQHGGEILVAGTGGKAVEGSPGEVTVVLKFTSMDALQAWYDSPEYQDIIDLRKNSTDGHIVFADGFVMPA